MACVIAIASVPAEHESLERKHERLQPQNQGMHEAKRINNVKNHAFESAGVFGNDRVMVIRVGIGDAAAAGRQIVNSAFVERLEKSEKGARPRHLLQVDQLLAATKLAGSNVFLYVRDHHGDDCK